MIRVPAGCFSSFDLGRIGLGLSPPPQFGHTFISMPSTQGLQKVHSKLQIMASVQSAGNALPQASQLGRSSSTVRISPSSSSTIPVVVDIAQALTLRDGLRRELRLEEGELDARVR